MERTSNVDCKKWMIVVLIACAAASLGACANTPRTQLSWPGYDTTLSRTSHASNGRHHNSGAYHAVQNTRDGVRIPDKKPRVTQVAQNEDSYQSTGTGSLFQWPVKGRVLSSFGSNDNGERNDGINIAAPLGEPIHASRSGTVTYAGNELKGYGNLILIRHEDGYVTAYAHAQSIVVVDGDHVLKGQVIGYAGETGDVSRPQVHFEIRRGVEPVNPQTLLIAYRAS